MFVAYMRRLPLLNIEGVHTLLSLWGKAPDFHQQNQIEPTFHQLKSLILQ